MHPFDIDIDLVERVVFRLYFADGVHRRRAEAVQLQVNPCDRFFRHLRHTFVIHQIADTCVP